MRWKTILFKRILPRHRLWKAACRKTALIAEFLKRHSDSLYFLATEESEMQNLNYFKTQVAEFTGNELLKSAAVDWFTVFKTLVEYKTETKNNRVRRVPIYRAVQFGIPVRYAKVWDTLLKDANVMLICAARSYRS